MVNTELMQMVKQAEELCDKRSFQEALTISEKIYKRWPTSIQSFYIRGRARWGIKNNLGALEDLEKAIALDNNFAKAYNYRGNALADLKRYEEALSSFNKAIEIDPNYSYPYNGKGNVLADQKQYKEALVCFDKAIEIDPNYPNPYNGKGNAFADQKQYKEALVCFDKAIKIDPNYPNPYNGKGNVLADQKQYKEALVCFDKAIKIDPLDAVFYGNKGYVLDDLERYDEALACYNKALELDPRDAGVYNNKGCTLESLKRYDEALACYNKALELDPRDAGVYSNKGCTLDSLKRYDEALTCYNTAIKLNPNGARYYNNRAILFEAIGQKTKALDDYKKCLSLDKNFRFAEYKISQLSKNEEFLASLQQIEALLSINEVQSNQGFLGTDVSQKSKEPCLNSSNQESRIFPMDRFQKFYNDPRKEDIYRASEDRKLDFVDFIAQQRIDDDGVKAFYILRRWNSYTPIVNTSGKHSRGGGYFLQLGKNGIVIDPGFDFIKNFMDAKFMFSQISKVFITHAHNDHDADLESIRTLLYVYNKNMHASIKRDVEKAVQEKTIPGLESMSNDALDTYIESETEKKYRLSRKVIDIYLSVSAFKKHAASLTLSNNEDYRVHVVDSGNKAIECEEGIRVIPIPACHFDLISDCDALGFIVEFEKFALVYTGDTGFTQKIGEEYGRIRAEYQAKGKDIVLLAHIGGFKAREDKPDVKRLESGEAFYKDHLGRNGIICLVDILRPKYCILSEFGEELDGLRESLTGLLTDTFDDLKIPFIPADIGLRIDDNANVCAIFNVVHDNDGSPRLMEKYVPASCILSMSIATVDALVYCSSECEEETLCSIIGAVKIIEEKRKVR